MTVKEFLNSVNTEENEQVEVSIVWGEANKIDSVCLWSYNNDTQYVIDSGMDFYEKFMYAKSEITPPLADGLDGLCNITVHCM